MAKATPAEGKQEDAQVEEDMKVKMKPTVMAGAQKNIPHTLKCWLSMYNFIQTDEAGCLVPEYDELTGGPKYMVNRCLIPHLDRSFTENFDEGWGKQFYAVAKDLSHIKLLSKHIS
ncbi:hypothetical protein FRC09_002866 [Ceratobasidium sp. 395]|nr:hypothetical protein FRC09_002866 [Ceratobasidium sp. 395]